MIQNRIATLEPIEADAEKRLPERIHLLRTGVFNTSKYGRLEITADDLKEMVTNFEAGHGRPGPAGKKGGLPVNFAHDKAGKAAAWINKVEADAEGNLWGIVEWTGAGKSEVEAGNWRYISSEFVPRCLGGFWTAAENATEKIRNVITGAATTNIPMFNGNHGIMASSEPDGLQDDTQVIYINASDEDKEQKMPTLDEVRVKDAATLTDEDKKVLADNKDQLSADEKAKFGLVEASADAPKAVDASSVEGTEGLVLVEASQIKTLREHAEEAQAKVEAAEAAKTELEKQVEAHNEQLKTIREKEVQASVKEHVARGAIVADQAENWEKLILADASMEETLKAIPSNKIVEADSIGDGDKGDGAIDASTIIDTKAKEIMASDSTVDYGTAILRVRESEPELAAKADRNE